MVSIFTLAYPPTSDTTENDLAPFVELASVIKLDRTTIFPFANFFPNIPSPN